MRQGDSGSEAWLGAGQGQARWSRAGRLLTRDGETAMIVSAVSRHHGVAVEILLQPGRGSAGAARARQLAMYLTHVLLGRSMTEVGHLFGRDRTTVAHACALIEDAREDPAFEQQVLRLEEAINGLIEASGAEPREARHAAR
jgi:chromosomal replication initiation ATPase DnaA